MTLLIDTGIFYAFQNKRARQHDAAEKALTKTLRGEFGRPFTSDYVYDETVTLVRARTGKFSEAKTVGRRILGKSGYPHVIKMIHVTEEIFEMAQEVFERYRDHKLSFTDATTLALVESYGIDSVLSFDADFDGLVDRLDPTTL